MLLSRNNSRVSSTPNNVDADDNSSGGGGDDEGGDDTSGKATTEKCRRRSNDVATRSTRRNSSVEERFASKMLLSYSREIICLFVGIVLSLGFAAFESVPPRVSRVPTARPFFNQSSLILDFYKGHLDAMVERASDADLTFVMYYAPWDAQSQAARHEFEKVAQYYYSKIFFAAINCWHPGSECRLRYNKIQSYPVLMLYSSRDSGILYRGIISAPYMIRFLESFLKPIVRITGRGQLARLLVDNDAVVVGFIKFNGLSESPGYREFYTAATHFLEKDPNRDVAFAIVTDPRTANDDFGMDSFPSASLVMWNETLIYPREKLFTSDYLLEWIGERMHKVALWLQPPGVKSLTLAPYFRDGPVLLLFTPRNPLHRLNYNFNLLKQVALQYYSCNGVLPMINTTDRPKEMSGNDAAIAHRERTKLCSLIVNQSKIEVKTSSVFVDQWINDSCCANVLINKCYSCQKTRIQAGVCGLSDENHQEICKNSDVFKLTEKNTENEEQQEFSCNVGARKAFHQASWNILNKKFKSSMLTGENDGRSAKAVKTAFLGDECKKLLVGNEYEYPIYPRVSSKGRTKKKMLLSACKRNKTLALIAIDSLQYSHFADALGIDILKRRDKTAVVILDSDRESQYSIEGIPSEDSLMDFVDSYEMGLLERTLRSESREKVFASHNSKERRTRKYNESGSGTAEVMSVPELTTDTFTKVVMDPTMNVVVMYHTPYCAFCSAVGYVYLTVAKYLDRIEYLSFVRIDGDNNDLPWEYSMDRYPSILFFPAKRKEDSTVYPFSLPVTVRNLLNFVLANLDDDTHVEALVDVCHLGSGEAPKDCIIRIRRLCLDIINNLLRSYRKLQRINGISRTARTHRRREILLKLNHIRDVHLILGSVDNLGKDDQKFQLIHQRFKTYHRNLMALDNRQKQKKRQ